MSIFAALNVYHDDHSSRSAALNMAIDEALLETSDVPVIRFYKWNHPGLSFGYFGKFADVANHAAERDLVRRWTGGGTVFHGDDLTYSIVIPATEPTFGESSTATYQNVHRALRNALAANIHGVELATVAALYERRNEIDSAVADRRYSTVREGDTGTCFSNPVRADVLVNGRKVAGGAQRRTRTALLHQGSIQHVDLGNGLAERFTKELSDDCRVKILGESLIERAHELAEEKYGSMSWLRRR